MIPSFEPSGDLPPGIHRATWQEFVDRFGWTAHRRRLLAGLQLGLSSLRAAGCVTAYVDGSFVTAKEVPNDFDVCWDITGVDAGQLDPILLVFDNQRVAQKLKFLGEFFPAQIPANRLGTVFLELFQVNPDTGSPKGIVSLDLRRLP